MANKKVAWSGKSYGGYWGTLAFISLLKIGLVPASRPLGNRLFLWNSYF